MQEVKKLLNKHPIIDVKDLKKSFSTYYRGESLIEAIKYLINRKKKVIKALKGISFSINEGEIIAFLGPNGAGKSTTIKILSGIMYPDEGYVNVLGYEPWSQRKSYVKNIGVLFGQKSQLVWDTPPIDSFYLHKAIYSIDDKAFNNRLKELIELLEIKDIIKKPTRQLSLGERMRCEFVMAMLHSPKIVFLDEPTIGLDIFAKEKIRRFIKKINKKERITFLITSHDLEDIEHLSDRVIVINHGEIIFNGDIDKLREKHKRYAVIKLNKKPNISKIKNIKGIEIIEHINYSLKISIDIKQIKLNELIKRFNEQYIIEDLELKPMPIAELIKELLR